MNYTSYKQNTRRISAEEYLKLTEKDKRDIEEIRISPAVLGEKGFGGFEVVYKYGYYNTKL